MTIIADGFDTHDAYVDATTEWDRLAWHKVSIMTAAELRKTCERPGCTCPWSSAPEGTQVTFNGHPGIVRPYPESWQRFPGWVPVEYRTGLSLTRISDMQRES